MKNKRLNPLAAEAVELAGKLAATQRTFDKAKTHENALNVQAAKRLVQQKIEEARSQFRVIE